MELYRNYLQKDCGRYKNEEKRISGLNVVYLEIFKELLKNQ